MRGTDGFCGLRREQHSLKNTPVGIGIGVGRAGWAKCTRAKTPASSRLVGRGRSGVGRRRSTAGAAGAALFPLFFLFALDESTSGLATGSLPT